MLAEASAAEDISEAPTSEFTLESRIDRLVQRIMEGLCVPFLGAGISMWAPSTTPSPPTLNASKIATNLAKKLAEHLQLASNSTVGHPRRSLRELGLDCAKMNDDGSFKKDTKGKELVPPLGEVAELCWSVLKPTGTCAILQLERWNELRPTAAHHYLAVLVREGLITEVLETNYDEFVEGAVQETFGSDIPGGEENNSAAPVISDLNSYRNHIASPRNDRQWRALVKVVKLNGCAAAYQRAMTAIPPPLPQEQDAAARRIILTEEQLQNWGDKNWARDLLNDRVRSRTLLFIGFGNADPLVRHHSVQVIREFQGNSSPTTGPDNSHGKSTNSERPWHDHKNAPFIAAYDPNLSFYQYQVLRAFRDAHTTKHLESSPSSLGQLDHVASVYANAFLGGDGPKLVPPSKTGLPADAFLAFVAARCICRLARERWFSPESPLHSYLQGALAHPRTLLAELCQALFTGNIEKPAPFAEWLQLQQPTTPGQESSPWATVCFTLRGQEPYRAGYRPFLDSPIKQPMLIVLMALLSALDEKGRLRISSGEELLRRAGAIQRSALGQSASSRIPAYRLVDADPKRGTRAVFATSRIDGFLLDEDGVRSVRTPEDMLPDHSVVIGLGRGNTSAFRRQIWVEVRQPNALTTPEAISSQDLSDGAPKSADRAPTVGVRAIREIYIIGDLAAIRGADGQSVDLVKARHNLQAIAHMPDSILGTSGNWRRYCREMT